MENPLLSSDIEPLQKILIDSFQNPYEFLIETLSRSRIDPLYRALIENPYAFIIEILQKSIIEFHGGSL